VAAFSPWLPDDAGVHAEHDGDWRVGPTFSVPLPIFDFGQAAREKVLAQRSLARQELEEQQLEVIEEVRLAYATYRQALEALAGARDRLLPLQNLQFQQAQRAYQSGDTDVATLLLAQSDQEETLSKILELQEKVTVARVKLERAAGGAGVADRLEAQAATQAASQPAAAGPAGAVLVPIPDVSTSRPATGSGQ
jgi:outer membrane protein TolC